MNQLRPLAYPVELMTTIERDAVDSKAFGRIAAHVGQRVGASIFHNGLRDARCRELSGGRFILGMGINSKESAVMRGRTYETLSRIRESTFPKSAMYSAPARRINHLSSEC